MLYNSVLTCNTFLCKYTINYLTKPLTDNDKSYDIKQLGNILIQPNKISEISLKLYSHKNTWD